MNAGKLDRSRWHEPLVSVVVTHHNYSDFVEEALLSLADQTYENWECVIVDDKSDSEHLDALKAIIAKFPAEKFRLVERDTNGGQILTFFEGVDQTSGEFVCLLDPDDRYHEDFLLRMMSTHTTSRMMGPVACCSQYLVKNGSIMSTFTRNIRQNPNLRVLDVNCLTPGREDWKWEVLYASRENGRHFFTSTVSLMFRRPALQFLRPHRELIMRNDADTLLGTGTHIMGGTLYLDEPLVYRLLHENNDWIDQDLFSSILPQGKRPTRSQETLSETIDVLLHNQAPGVREFMNKVASSNPQAPGTAQPRPSSTPPNVA